MRVAAVRALLVLTLLSAVATPGCKRHKPPPRTRIWIGPSHACSLQKAGELECWGANEAGQLGDRTTAPHALPAPVLNGGTPTDLAIGARHTCALSGGIVQCWGDGARGQLGTGLTMPLSAPTLAVNWKGTAMTDATAIAAGGDRTCALAPESVRCWGEGRPDAEEPASFRGTSALIAVGAGHLCAAFSEPRLVRCSGADDVGQSAGTQPILPGQTLISLAAGGRHTCAVLEDGSVQCWGANDQGQLGDGSTNNSRVPALVSALPPAVEVRAGANHTCARLKTNTVACWGDNREHQLANGTTKPSSKPLPVPGLVGVLELSVGGDSACARLADGGVRCWGANASGQLGDGTTTPHDVPMPVKAMRAPPTPKAAPSK